MINQLYSKIQEQCLQKDLKAVNVMVQIQSYGRVFVYDQMGLVVDKDQPICIFPKDDTIEERIIKGLQSFYHQVEQRK
jgi:hypothetical protein